LRIALIPTIVQEEIGKDKRQGAFAPLFYFYFYFFHFITNPDIIKPYLASFLPKLHNPHPLPSFTKLGEGKKILQESL